MKLPLVALPVSVPGDVPSAAFKVACVPSKVPPVVTFKLAAEIEPEPTSITPAEQFSPTCPVAGMEPLLVIIALPPPVKWMVTAPLVASSKVVLRAAEACARLRVTPAAVATKDVVETSAADVALNVIVPVDDPAV